MNDKFSIKTALARLKANGLSDQAIADQIKAISGKDITRQRIQQMVNSVEEPEVSLRCGNAILELAIKCED